MNIVVKISVNLDKDGLEKRINEITKDIDKSKITIHLDKTVNYIDIMYENILIASIDADEYIKINLGKGENK